MLQFQGHFNDYQHSFERSKNQGICGIYFPAIYPYLGGVGKGEGMPTQALMGLGGLCHFVPENAKSKSPRQKIFICCLYEYLGQTLPENICLIESTFFQGQVLLLTGVPTKKWKYKIHGINVLVKVCKVHYDLENWTTLLIHKPIKIGINKIIIYNMPIFR